MTSRPLAGDTYGWGETIEVAEYHFPAAVLDAVI